MKKRLDAGEITISTHALREEGDPYSKATIIQASKISTHALREEGDSLNRNYAAYTIEFLPTPSARRATANVP